MAMNKESYKYKMFKKIVDDGMSKKKDKILNKDGMKYSLAFTRKQIRQIARKAISPVGSIGASKFSKLNSRKERREEEGKDFKPQYNGEVIRVQPKSVLKAQLNEERRKELNKNKRKTG